MTWTRRERRLADAVVALNNYQYAAVAGLPDSEFGDFDWLARQAGYSSGKACANKYDLWSATVAEAVAFLLRDSEEAEAAND